MTGSRDRKLSGETSEEASRRTPASDGATRSGARSERRNGSVTAIAGLVVFAAGVATHHEILGYWFTGSDTLSLIESSRITGLSDIWTIFTRPLMHGTQFVDGALFYRPVASLSYGIDYVLWGLSPFGYHLTDLLLHGVTAVLVFLLVLEVTGGDATGGDTGDVTTALVGGLVFALHPLSVEVVPTPARRQDVLAATFLTGAILLFVRWLDHRDRQGHLAGSVVAYLLALGSKETAVVLVPVAGAWFLWAWVGAGRDVRDLRDLRAVGTAGGRALAPFVGATVVYLGVRTAVLGGLGGYVGREVHRRPLTAIATRYVRSLLYPVDHLGFVLPVDPWPIPGGLSAVLAVSLVLAGGALRAAGGIESLLESRRGRTLTAFGLWALAPLPLLVLVGRYTVRSGYMSTVPVAAGLALVLVPAARRVRIRGTPSTTGNRSGEDPATSRGRTHRMGHAAVVLVTTAVVLSLVAGSPLLHEYDGWERAGELSHGTLTAVASEVEDANTSPGERVVVVDGIAHTRSTSHLTAPPRARSVTFVWANSIESWLRLRHSTDGDVRVGNLTVIRAEPDRVWATSRVTGNEIRVELHYGGGSGR